MQNNFRLNVNGNVSILLTDKWAVKYRDQLFRNSMLREQHPGTKHNQKSKILPYENNYQIGKLIGQGTFGKVYEAVDKNTGKKVAIKEVFQDKRYKNREFDVMSRLENDNIIFMKDYYFTLEKQNKFLFLVMDMYDTNLQALFKQHRKAKKMFAPHWIKILGFQLFKGLYYLKNNNVCHRDLKPPNILIDLSTLELRICDFGSAKIFDQEQKNVSYICSRYYRAPELLFAYSLYKTQIDVWSAGCILAQFLTRQPLFPGDSALEQLIEIMKVIGTPSEAYLNKYTSQMEEKPQLPKIPPTGWTKLLKRYKPQPLLVDLIQKILVYDIKQRLGPFQALCHPYFHSLNDPQMKQYTDKLPNLFKFDLLRTPKNGKQILKLQELYMKPLMTSNMKEVPYGEEEKLETGDNTPQHKQENNQ